MIKSMTGFGKSVCEFNGKKISVEIKSLNSKQTDINTKLTNSFRSKEMEIRSIVSEKLERGKIDFNIIVENTADAGNYTINKNLALKYFKDLKPLADEINTKETDFLQMIIKMPDVLTTASEEIDDNEWLMLKSAIDSALKLVDEFRIHEGDILEKDFISRINLIASLLDTVESMDKKRVDTIKDRIRNNLIDVIGKDKIDENRFEQELIYYIEKLDITEEILRLKKHCDYFIETIKETSNGKKLNFITQEIGREINTIGSKANDAEIQKIVVQMKDELEKVKEQLMNIL